MAPRKTLTEVLLAAQRAGTLGARPVDQVIEHARHFVAAVPRGTHSVIDIGSGAGIPGLVIAVDLPHVTVTLVDRRATRVDALHRAIAALELTSRVTAVTADAASLAKDPAYREMYDVAVCRGLGAPEYTASLSRPFLRGGGVLIVSEPPHQDQTRWPESLLAAIGFVSAEPHGAVVCLTATAHL